MEEEKKNGQQNGQQDNSHGNVEHVSHDNRGGAVEPKKDDQKKSDAGAVADKPVGKQANLPN